ncbi:MAG: saccharopine dehydrogenase NADP-binding domain-containing protein [Deltaproteobacteria bacterium]|nr:saccharopine dehydrogenase NADP-binding domain-containing protein [Deltaproteobacteria bacterium]
MARIIVLGGGQQGRVIAADLARRHEVTVADVRALSLPPARSVQADLADPAVVTRLVAAHDLAVGALPARLGFAAAKSAIAAGRSYVDVAFFAEDVAALDAAAKRAKVAILPDCGLAPGISNLVVGRALAQGPRREICIEVGGVAADKSKPYGYVVTWSPEDLADEFKRPARIIRGGKVVSLPATSELERVEIDGVGTMESFLTDGLRTLLALEGVTEMTEKTLRWPGHVEAVRPLVKDGTFAKTMTERCRDGLDLVVFRIRVDGEQVLMVVEGRPEISAMARTTALTTAAFAHYAATTAIGAHGVLPPEQIGRDPVAYKTILDALALHEILLSPRYPFLG